MILNDIIHMIIEHILENIKHKLIESNNICGKTIQSKRNLKVDLFQGKIVSNKIYYYFFFISRDAESAGVTPYRELTPYDQSVFDKVI